jgi:hypothetical protein
VLAAVAVSTAACKTSQVGQETAGVGTPSATTATYVPPENGIVLVGDSLMQEASPSIGTLRSDRPVVNRYWGGTAPCDWTSADLYVRSGSIVVISFTGNSLTTCMSDGNGGHLHGQALLDKYRADVATLVNTARAADVWVILVGQPTRGNGALGNDEVEGINAIYRSLAAAPKVAFVDAAAAVENPDGTFAHDLPCAPYEPTCDPSGRNVVRSDDGIHFCPGFHSQPCPAYSSGAYRFAWMIAAAVADPASYDTPPAN